MVKEYCQNVASKLFYKFFKGEKNEVQNSSNNSVSNRSYFRIGACGNGNGAKESNDIVKEVKEDTTITFWHAMNGVQEEALTKLTKDFMKENQKLKWNYKINLLTLIYKPKSIRL